MHFRSRKRAPLPEDNLASLPDLDQYDADVLPDEADAPPDEDDTRALGPVLRGLPAEPDVKAATLTEQFLFINGPSAHKAALMVNPQRRQARRQVVVMAVGLLVFLSAGTPMLSARVGALAFGMGINTHLATFLPQAGIAPLTTPAGSHNGAGLGLTGPTPTPTPPPAPPPPSYTPGGPYGNDIPPPGYSSFAMTEPSPDPWAGSWGQCTWWAQYKRQDEDFSGFGNAANWADAARARGYTVTSTAAANATVVFMPGVQGASSAGHVSHVEKLLTGGWVLVSEMNFYWNGGGFARVDYRYIHVGSGVWFIH